MDFGFNKKRCEQNFRSLANRDKWYTIFWVQLHQSIAFPCKILQKVLYPRSPEMEPEPAVTASEIVLPSFTL